MFLKLSFKFATTLFLALSTIGSHATGRSDALFLPNPFGDEFREVRLASEMASLSKAVYSVEQGNSTLSELRQYNLVRFNDTGSTEVMIVTTESTDTSLARIIVVLRGTDESPDGGMCYVTTYVPSTTNLWTFLVLT
jgi:hypothetical protein